MHSPKIVYRKDAKDAKKISWFFRKKMALRSYVFAVRCHFVEFLEVPLRRVMSNERRQHNAGMRSR